MTRAPEKTKEARFLLLKEQLHKDDLTREKIDSILTKLEVGCTEAALRYIAYFKLYFGFTEEEPLTYQEIATRYNVSKGHVGQMIQKIIRRSKHPSHWN